MRIWTWFYFIVRDFTKFDSFLKICQCLLLHFVIKCVLNGTIRDKLCIQNKMNPFWTFFLVYFCYYFYSCYFCYEMKFLLFFLNFCYHMKCPGIWKTSLSLFFSYMHYSCHTIQLKYTGTIWTTLYVSKANANSKQ